MATVCVSATLAHLILNWAWLKKIASSGKLWRLAAGLSAGAILILGIYALPLDQGDNNSHDQGQAQGKQHRKGW